MILRRQERRSVRQTGHRREIVLQWAEFREDDREAGTRRVIELAPERAA